MLAVHNKPALAEELATKYSNNPIGSQPLTVQSISDAPVNWTHLVLYSEAEGDDLKALLSAVKGEPTLVVTALQPLTAVWGLLQFDQTGEQPSLRNQRQGC